MSKKLSKSEFVTRATQVHFNKYSYDNVIYESMLKKISITCPEHGDWLQKPADHLLNHGCPKCKSYKASCKWEDIKSDFQQAHGTYYTYDESSYVRNSIKMRILCPVHGEFWQKPEIHKKGAGCKHCTASSGPGKYCETLFKRKPELKDAPGILYFLELNDIDGTIFYKIGMTVNLRTRFYDFIKNNGGRICWTIEDTLYECFQKEQFILSKYADFKYNPQLVMSGKTECFSKEIKNDI